MLRDSEFARRTETGIQIRPGAIRLRWDLTELATSDGHLARGAFTGSARALPEPNELKMLDEALLAFRSVVTLADVVAHFAEAISAAARKHARGVDAQTLLGDEGKQALTTALMQAAGAVAFSCGIEMLPPAQVDLDCPTLQRQRFEEMQRQTAQRRAADQVDHLRRSAELFGQFQAIRAAAPQLSPGQVLSRITVADQADVFRAAVLASAQKHGGAKLWAVAGSNLVRIDSGESARPEILDVPLDLGPLRSVRGDGTGGLLLGCRAGVLRVNPASPADAAQYRDPETTSQLGFNAAVILGDFLWAAHGEAGLVCWNPDQPDKPRISIRPGSSTIPSFSPRNLARFDSNRLILSSGRQMIVASQDGSLTPIAPLADADIVAIYPQPGRILTAHADGQICSWNADELKLDCQQRRAGRINAATVLPWLGDARLLLATQDGPVICLGPDDELLTQYSSPYQGLRIAAAAADAVAAVTSDRQRVILWHSWDGRRPYADLYLYGLTKHRIGDIAFV
ncbi:MAG: hypothetical protein ABSC42_07905 [Tepidisphaeraceae bacterium]|jgi:hypothetical protein